MSLSSLIDPTHPDSPQLLTVLIAAVMLPVSLALIMIACFKVIWTTGNLGSGACWALGLCVLALCATCGIALKFKDIIPAGMIAPGVTSTDAKPSGCAGHADGGNL
jgi:hypothetical protein